MKAVADVSAPTIAATAEVTATTTAAAAASAPAPPRIAVVEG